MLSPSPAFLPLAELLLLVRVALWHSVERDEHRVATRGTGLRHD